MWTFDDNVKYISLITDAQRSLTAWTFTNSATGTSYTTQPPYPKLGSTVTNVAKTSVTTSGTFTATSNYTITPNANTFAVGFYYHKLTPYITSVRIGYKVGAGATQWSSSISTPEFYEWGFASTVFSANPVGANIVIEFTYSAPVASDTVSILINGLTAGNLAEDSNMVSLGSQVETLPSTLGISASFTQGISVDRYNSALDLGYIITKDKVSYARNTSFPMTFGSENVLLLSPNEVDSPTAAPSLVLPGHGFLNTVEKYKTRTFEAWIRVKAQTTIPRRIIGPINGTDGVYVNGAYIMLSVDNNIGSFYVGEWDRPMLLQVSTTINSAKMFINGELVVTLLYETDELSLTSYYKSAPATYDWIGFYCYSDVPRMEVDCVAVYAYEVDNVLALRRFVYAQGVSFPSSLVARAGGEAVIPDYSVSNYANNYTYGQGQRFRFSDGDVLNNVNVLSDRITPPAYVLPEVRIQAGASKTSQDLFAEQAVSDYLDLQPAVAWDSIESHLYFDKISQLTEKTKGIYIIATRSEANASKQILFKIFDKINGNFLEVYTITSGTNNIVYRFSYNGVATTLATVTGNVIGTKFGAGIDIDALVAANATQGSNLLSFFSNQDRLAMYVGGDEEFTSNATFTGKIYKVGFANARNLSKISSLFTSGRFSGSATTLNSHTASYTLIVKNFAGNVFLDIATNMYWQESIPLSSLAKFVSGDYLLDYLQLNLDYPKPITFSSSEYNTDSSEARLYLTFQNVSSTPADIVSFGSSVRVSGTNVIEDTSAFATTKYEVVDGTVVYLPATILDKSLYFAVVHLEINTSGNLTNSIEIRNVQVASQALSRLSTSPTEIGTKTGSKLIGYAATATTKNPIVLPKENDPHLYLSSNSGLTIAGTNAATRGLYLPLNAGESDTFDIGIIQATMKFQIQAFSTSDVLLFEVEKEDGSAIKFYADSINATNTRARIFAKDDLGADYTYLEYFVNGIQTEYPAVSLDEWVTIGIRFTEHFDIASQTAKLKISGPMLLNNIFYSQLSAGDEASKIMSVSKWANILYTGSTINTWNAYTSSTWLAELDTTADATEINGLEIDDVYKAFTGTSKIVATYDATDKKVKTKSYAYIVYIGSKSDTITSTPL
jgi:hypothetical protein